VERSTLMRRLSECRNTTHSPGRMIN